MNAMNLILLAKDVAELNVPQDTAGKLLYSLQVTLVGMGIVFLVLIILMAVLYLFKLAFYRNPEKQKKQAQPAPVSVPEKTQAQPVATADQSEEIAAVLAAAVAAYYQTQPAVSRYRIRSFKRI